MLLVPLASTWIQVFWQNSGDFRLLWHNFRAHTKRPTRTVLRCVRVSSLTVHVQLFHFVQIVSVRVSTFINLYVFSVRGFSVVHAMFTHVYACRIHLNTAARGLGTSLREGQFTDSNLLKSDRLIIALSAYWRPKNCFGSGNHVIKK